MPPAAQNAGFARDFYVSRAGDGLLGAELRDFALSRDCVRIGGEIWSARAYVPEQVIPVGTVVDVFEIRGATALVYAEDTT